MRAKALLAAGVVSLAAILPATAYPTAAQVTAAVKGSLSIKTVPATLTPSLQQASSDATAVGALSYIQPSCNAYVTSSLLASPAACFYGSLTSKRTVILYGDSNAGNWAPALDVAFKRLGLRLAIVAMPGCWAAFITYTATWLQDAANCNEWHSNLAPLAKSLKPIAVMLSSESLLPVPPGWSSGIATAFQVLSGGQANAMHILIGTSPNFGQGSPVPACLAAYPTQVQMCTLNYTNPTAQYAQVLQRDQQLAASSGATLLPVARWLCYAKKCPVIVKHMLVYVDQDHTSIAYSQYLTGVFQSALKRVGL